MELQFKDKGELTEYITANSKELGLIVRTEADDESYRNSWLQSELAKGLDDKADKKGVNPAISTAISSIINKIHTGYDNDIFEITGRKKLPEEKTYKVFREELEKAKGLQKKIEALEKGGAKSVDEDVYKTEIATLKAQVTDLNKSIADRDHADMVKDIDKDIEVGIAGVNLAVPAHIKTDEEKQAYLSNQKRMLQLALKTDVVAKKDGQGKVVYYDVEGNLLSSTKDGSPLSATDVLKLKYGSFIYNETSRTATGTGAPQSGVTSTGKFKTATEIVAHIAKEFPDLSGMDWNNKFEDIAKESGVMPSK